MKSLTFEGILLWFKQRVHEINDSKTIAFDGLKFKLKLKFIFNVNKKIGKKNFHRTIKSKKSLDRFASTVCDDQIL